MNIPEYAWMFQYKQDSEYVSGPNYAKILNMAGFLMRERYTGFWICQNMPWQSSEYILAHLWQGSEYERVTQGSKYSTIYLNMSEWDANMPQYVWSYDNKQGSEYVSYNT